MKNYYEILEVDRKASPEVIDKAYKTLAKKYHPDLQDENNKNIYAEKMKEINEAYDVLSNDYKKTTYDEQLENSLISKSEYEKVIRENSILKHQLEKEETQPHQVQRQKEVQDTNTITNMSRMLNSTIRQAYNDAYNNAYKDAYVNDLKSRGYKIKYKHDLKYYFKLIIYIAIIVLIGILIYQIPPVKSYFTSLYNGNVYFKAIVDIFKNTIQSGF